MQNCGTAFGRAFYNFLIVLVFFVIFDTITQAGAQAIRVREPGQAGNRAAISDHLVVSGNPGFFYLLVDSH